MGRRSILIEKMGSAVGALRPVVFADVFVALGAVSVSGHVDLPGLIVVPRGTTVGLPRLVIE